MPRVIRVTDFSQGHSQYPPSIAIENGSTVKINGLSTMRFGDPYTPHTKYILPHDTHSPLTLKDPSRKVFVENRVISLDGDPLSCGDVAGGVITLPVNVFVGGKGLGGPATQINANETTGYSTEAPKIIYEKSALQPIYVYALDAQKNQVYVKGCPYSLKITEAYSPQIEEITGQVYKNFSGIGSNLPSYAPPGASQAIEISYSEDSNAPLPGGLFLDSNSGEIFGAIEGQYINSAVPVRINATNFSGTTSIQFFLTVRKKAFRC